VVQIAPDMPDNHGFTAHITLKYLEDGEKADPAWFDLPAFDVQFNEITAKLGTERSTVALTAAGHYDPDQPRDSHGMWVDNGDGTRTLDVHPEIEVLMSKGGAVNAALGDDNPRGHFATVLDPPTLSGHKLHIYSDTPEATASAAFQVYDTAAHLGLGMKIAMPSFHELAKTTETQIGKGVTIYMPRKATAEADTAAVVEAMEGWHEEKPIAGDKYIGNGVSGRYELSDNAPDYDLTHEEYHRYYIPASLAASLELGFDPDQLRDYHGRWSDGDDVVPGSMRQPINGWKPIDPEKLRQDQIQKSTKGIARATGVSVEELSQDQLKMIQEMYAVPPAGQVVYDKKIGEDYYRIDFRMESAPYNVEHALATIEQLATLAPAWTDNNVPAGKRSDPIYIQFSDGGVNDENTLATTIRGWGTMYLRDDVLDDGPNTSSRGWFPTSLEDVGQLDSVLAHEWGHMIDSRSNDESIADMISIPREDRYISQFAATDPEGREYFAEAFSDYYLSGDRAASASQKLAKDYGWPTIA